MTLVTPPGPPFQELRSDVAYPASLEHGPAEAAWNFALRRAAGKIHAASVAQDLAKGQTTPRRFS